MLTREINEDTTSHYYATLLDGDGSLVMGSQLSTLELWLYDIKTGTIINGRGVLGGVGQNALNAHDVAVFDALQAGEELVRDQVVPFTYNLHWEVQRADNVIVTDSLTREGHTAVFRATYGPTKSITRQVRLVVLNLRPIA